MAECSQPAVIASAISRTRGAVTAHAADDVLREADPDLLVVLELRMVLEILDRGRPGLGVAVGVERQPVMLAGRPVALGSSRPELDEREVDVEEDRFGSAV